MADPITHAIPVKYTGLYSDQHLIDLQEFGVSLQGLAKLSNSAVDFYLHGRITTPRHYQVRLFAAPPEPRCVLLDIVGLMVGSGLPLYAPLLCDMANEYLVPMIKAIIFKRLKRNDLSEKALDQMFQLTREHLEFSKQVHAGQMQDKVWLQGHIDALTERNSGPLKQLVRPVGSTCRQIEVGKPDGVEPLRITEAEAEILTSRDELQIEDAREFHGIFEGVDKTNGTCKFLIRGDAGAVPGKITDPALMNALNVYTHSLDTDTPVIVTAKAVMKDGEIERLYISDGRPTRSR